MAMANVPTSLLEEVTCSICLECFTDPVTIDCGHSFCLGCITECMKREDLVPSCPECRQSFRSRNLNPNKRMANIIEMIQRTKSMSMMVSLCEEHEERLQLFCQTDETVLCLVCHQSQEHKTHHAVPIKEAVEGYKVHLLQSLAALKTQLEKVQRLERGEESRTAECRRQSARERQRIVNEFEALQRFVKEQQCLLLSQLEEQENQILSKIQMNISQLEEQNSSLKQLIAEIEAKCQQPDVELLKDVRSMLSRCEEVKVCETAEDAPEKATHLSNFYQQHVDLQRMITNFIEWCRVGCFAVDVTLDPETAHPYLILSDDQKSVTFGATQAILRENPKRFTSAVLVLGAKGLCSGRHYWEVEVGDKTDWGVGVCRQSVSRKDKTTLLPEDGFWGVWLLNGEAYWASTSPGTRLTPRVKPRMIGVFLNYEAGVVSFYSVEDKCLLFTFTDIFSQDLYPYFSPCQPENGRNTGALTIHPVKIFK